MISKIVIIAVLFVVYTLAEAPIDRNRFQRFRQAQPRQFFARQEEAPYPASQGGEPAAEYGPPKPTYGPPPPTTTPSPEYGSPAAPGADVEPGDNSDTEVVAQPSRFSQFGEKLTAPSKKSPQKFSQRLELQQQVQQFPNQRVVTTPFVAPVQQFVAPVQYAALQQADGSYFIQLPSGSIQRVNYLAQPSLVDNSGLAKLQFRPIAEVQSTVTDPQFYVNTLVQSQVSTEADE